MKNLHEYQLFVQSLEKRAQVGLFFHHINSQIYITDFTNKLLGVWDIEKGHPVSWKNT